MINGTLDLSAISAPRVIEQTIRQKLPEGFQRSEFLIDHGMLDLLIERSQMRDTLISCLNFMMGAVSKVDSPVENTSPWVET